MALYLIVFKPFKEDSKNYQEIFNECCILASSFVLFSFSSFDQNTSDQITYGWVFISILIFNMSVNVAKGLYESYGNFKTLFKRYCLNKCRKKVSVKQLRNIIAESVRARL